MRKIILAQIGIGNWGENLLRNFTNNSQAYVKAVCELNADIRRNFTIKYPGLFFTRDINEILDDPEIEGVIIATQAKHHYEICEQSLLKGKHVFVEKPMTVDFASGQKLVELANKVSKILMVGHLLEYHPAYLKVKQIIENDELGEVYYIYSTRVNLGVIRKDENALWSFAPHDVSVSLMLFNQMPHTILSTGQCYLQEGIEDVIFTTLHFHDKKMAQINVSWLDPHKVRKLTVVGSKKMLVLDDMSSTEKIKIYDKGIHVKRKYVDYDEAITLRFGDINIPYINMEEPLKYECKHFIDCISNNSKPKTDGLSGLRVVQVLEAAQKSLRRNGAPVTIDQRF